MHDLLRAYAARLTEEEPEAERTSALDRLFDYCLAAAARCMVLDIATRIGSQGRKASTLRAAGEALRRSAATLDGPARVGVE